MSKQIKAIIMLLILLISLCAPVMAADADTSSTSIDSTISYSKGNKEPQFLLPLAPGTPSAEAHLKHYRILFICDVLIAVCAIVIVLSGIQIIRINHSQAAKKRSKHQRCSNGSHKYKQ